MKRNPGRKPVWAFAVAAFVLTACATPAIGGDRTGTASKDKDRDRKKSQQPAVIEPTTLVWPLPPDKPRIKYITAITGNKDVEPPSKQPFLERLAKVEKTRELKFDLLKPYGVTTDSKGRLFVSDTRQREVFVFDRDKKKVSYVGQRSQTTFRTPSGVTVDAKDRVWVADTAGHCVYAFDSKFNVLMMLGNNNEFEGPAGIVVDSERQRLYVVDTKKHLVLVFDSDTGKQVGHFGVRGPGNGEFNFPTNIALDRTGRIYVVDTMGARVQVFNSDYKFLEAWGAWGDRPGQFARPKGIALDSFGNVYVTDAAFSNVQIFDGKRRLLMFFGGLGDKPGRFSVPAGIHVDRNDSIYVVDSENKRVQIFQLLDGRTEDAPVASPLPSRAVGKDNKGN